MSETMSPARSVRPRSPSPYVRVNALILAVTLVFVVSCGGGKADPSSTNISPYVLSELPNASPFQRTILADGAVSAAEYESAVLATMQCLDEKGVPHSAPRLNSNGYVPRWQYTLGPWPEEEDARYSALYQECYEEYERAVASVWVDQESPSKRDLQELQAAVLDCLRQRAGLEFPDYASLIAQQEQLDSQQLAVVGNCKVLVFQGENLFEE